MFRHRVIMGTHKGVAPTATVDSVRESRRSPTKNMLASSGMQQQSLEEGVELNEESKSML